MIMKIKEDNNIKGHKKDIKYKTNKKGPSQMINYKKEESNWKRRLDKESKHYKN